MDLIKSKNIAMGTTEHGRYWAVKALHPADSIVEARGIPDQSTLPSVFQHYQRQLNVANPTPGTAGIWSADIYILGHPLILAAVCSYDSVGAYSWSYVVNESWGASGDPWNTRRDLMCTQVEKYRMVYESITVHLDAAAVTNQGMIAVAQYPLAAVTGSADSSVTGSTFLQRKVELFNELPKTYSQLMSMPNAYTGNAREGAYASYKLSSTHQRWKNARDVRAFIPYGNASGLSTAATGIGYPAGAPSGTTVSGLYPYGLGGLFTGAAAGTQNMPPRCDVGVIHVSAQNLHYLSALTLTFRIGLELQVNPGSPLVPFIRTAPPHDAQAIDAYYAISREMKDAYPEDFNSLEKILPYLWAVAKGALSVIPGGSLMAGAAEGLYDKLRSKKKDKTSMTPSLAEVEERQQAIATKSALSRKSLNRRRPVLRSLKAGRSSLVTKAELTRALVNQYLAAPPPTLVNMNPGKRRLNIVRKAVTQA